MDQDGSRHSSVEVRRLYAKYEDEIMTKRRKLEDPTADRASFDEMIARVQNLYEEHASRTKSARIIDIDQRVFRDAAEIILERTRNQMRDESSDLSFTTMIRALQTKARAKGSGTAVLQKMGEYFVRGSKVAVVSPSLPWLDDVNRRVICRGERQRSDRPRGPAEEAGRTNEAELESEADRIFKLTQTKILRAVADFSAQHPGKELQLYRLVFDKYNFVRTLENFFAVSVMVKERKLWLGSNEAGLPIIGIHTAKTNEHSSEGRHQFNLNFNAEVYALQTTIYGEEEPMIPRDEYEDEA